MSEEKSVIIDQEGTVETVSEEIARKLNNPRVHKVMELEIAAEKQKELELERAKSIRVQQEYIGQMITSVNENLSASREEKALNEEFERQIRGEVYQMHGLSEDKLQGMEERKKALVQGSTFSLFFLSAFMIVLCGLLHGFGEDITAFMAFYTALQASLLGGNEHRPKLLIFLLRILYFTMLPIMITVFVCYELKYPEYDILVPIFTVAGVVVLVLGVLSYFLYDPYKADKKQRRKADIYMKQLERTAKKDVKLREKAFGKEEKRRRKAEEKEQKEREKEELRAQKDQEKKEEKERKREALSEKKEALAEKAKAVKDKLLRKDKEVPEASENEEMVSGTEEEKTE